MRQLRAMCEERVGEYELTKVQNKFEANTLFGEVNVMDKAMNLCFYEMLGDVSLVNRGVVVPLRDTRGYNGDGTRAVCR